MQIRALTDLNLSGFAVPINRVAVVDDAIVSALVASGQASNDAKAVEQALLMNPDVIELSGVVPLPKSYVIEDAAEETALEETAAKETAPAKPAKSK